MDLLLLRVFQRQVADQCRFVLASVPLINKGEIERDQDTLWIGCQMFVVGAGNVSKALWGDGRSRRKTAPVRQPLRDSLQTDDSSPLYDVAMRNHFEHYDERLDRWWAESPTHNHLDRHIGAGTVGGLAAIEMFRVYDPDTMSVVFWGEEFALNPIATECERIIAIAHRESSKPHWST